MRKTLFLYAVAAVQEPSVVAEQGGQSAKVLLDPTLIMAPSYNAALVKAGSLIEGDYDVARTVFTISNLKDTGRDC